MPNAYIVPVLITAACAVAVTAVVRRLSRRLRARATTEIWDQAFLDHLFRSRDAERPPLTVPGPGRDDFPDRVDPDDDATGRRPHPSENLTPLLPTHLTGEYLTGLVAGATPITRVRTGSPGGAGGLDVLDFADGSSLVVMPGDPEAASLIDVALSLGRPVRLLGTSEIGGGWTLTFGMDEDTTYALADRLYVRPPA
ncbi:hypothetical protein ACFZBU_23130 [Embleya sp. NPDC008237]|uniref:hypothetical protein n=1 Tax=Embleya sp. NPDC008237 TaxID=3363978 RepID=UPI0036E2D7F3